jgi:hypothetical protein
MNKLKSSIVMALVLCLLAFSLTFMDYLALHDIKQDYISKDMIERFKLTTTQEVPTWTDTPGEWLVVNISLVVRFFFLIFIVIVLIKSFRQMQEIKKLLE